MHKKKSNFKILFLIFLFSFIFAGIVLYLFYSYSNINIYSGYETKSLGSTDFSQTVEKVQEDSLSIADMIENVSRSVVGISKLKNNSSSIFSQDSVETLGLGTGIIVSSDGYILSNSHVTGEKYSSCYVTLENGITYNGSVVWSDSELDLSITKINCSNLPFVTFGDSSSIRTGESVYAIGNPIGYEFRRTVTSGIISATNRTIKLEENGSVSYMTDLIQTDATINPGNSGGPLLSPDGKVIGINTVKVVSAEGIGFAIPVNVVLPVVYSFIENGSFESPVLGISAYDSEVIPYLSSNASFSSGIYVVQVLNNSAAANAGLQIGDVILSIDGTILNTMNDLKQFIFTKKPGDSVLLKISRNNLSIDITVTLGK